LLEEKAAGRSRLFPVLLFLLHLVATWRADPKNILNE